MSATSSSSQPVPQTKQFDLSGHLFRQDKIAQHMMSKKKKLKQQLQSSGQVTVKPGQVHVGLKTKNKPTSTNNQDKEASKVPEPPKHKSELIYEQLKNPNAKLYALFLKTTMPFFEIPNQVGASLLMVFSFNLQFCDLCSIILLKCFC